MPMFSTYCPSHRKCLLYCSVSQGVPHTVLMEGYHRVSSGQDWMGVPGTSGIGMEVGYPRERTWDQWKYIKMEIL